MKFVIDLDGTLLNNDLPNLDSVEFMAELSKRKVDFMIMTNSVCHPDIIINRLQNVGIKVSVDSVLNPIVSINSYLKRQKIRNAFIVGSDQEISQVHVDHEDDDPEIVLFLDFEKNNLDYNYLQKIFIHIQSGVPVISASGSTYYLKGDHKQIDTGSFVKMFESLSGNTIPIFGKPSENYFNEALALLRSDASDTVVVGDDWRTDVLGGKKVGFKTVLLKSGKYKDDDEKKGHPDFTVPKLIELFDIMENIAFYRDRE